MGTTAVDFIALKERYPLDDVVRAAGVELTGRGNVLQGPCPFHEETEGSFTVYLDTSRYYCFGCDAKGDVLEFVQRTEGVSLNAAVERLTGGTYPVTLQGAGKQQIRKKDVARRSADPEVVTAVARHYAAQLQGEMGEGGRLYLSHRGITLDTARKLGLGYALGDGLAGALQAEGIGERQLRDVGFLVGRDELERFREMVMVPEVQGRQATWLVGRSINHTARPRFQALPGPKPILGLDRLGAGAPDIVLTEGLFDWLTLVQWGMPACALLGTHGLERGMADLAGRRQVFLAFDADDGGREAAQRCRALLEGRGLVVELPAEVADVAEMAVMADGEERFRAALKAARRTAGHTKL